MVKKFQIFLTSLCELRVKQQKKKININSNNRTVDFLCNLDNMLPTHVNDKSHQGSKLRVRENACSWIRSI